MCKPSIEVTLINICLSKSYFSMNFTLSNSIQEFVFTAKGNKISISEIDSTSQKETPPENLFEIEKLLSYLKTIRGFVYKIAVSIYKSNLTNTKLDKLIAKVVSKVPLETTEYSLGVPLEELLNTVVIPAIEIFNHQTYAFKG